MFRPRRATRRALRLSATLRQAGDVEALTMIEKASRDYKTKTKKD